MMEIAEEANGNIPNGQVVDEVNPRRDSSKDAPGIPERLRAARLERLLDQGQLGTRAGMPATSISLFESGKRTPNVDNLIRLANVLEVSLDYLTGRSDDPSSHVGGGGVPQHQLEVKRQLEQIELIARETRAWFGSQKRAPAS